MQLQHAGQRLRSVTKAVGDVDVGAAFHQRVHSVSMRVPSPRDDVQREVAAVILCSHIGSGSKEHPRHVRPLRAVQQRAAFTSDRCVHV